MMSYYRRFIKDFGTIASSLFNLTKDSVKFEWTQGTSEAFIKLRDSLIRAPILVYPNFNHPFEIFSDASGVGIGAVLVQKIKDVYHPIAFASRQLNKHEKNYSTSEREMLAIVWAAKYFNIYIYGRHIIFHTDHRPICTLSKSSEPNGRLYKLYNKLQGLDYEIKCCPGKLNNTADILSRGPEKLELNVVQESINTINLDFDIDWEKEQREDKETALVRLNIETSNKNDWRELPNNELWRKNRDLFLIKDSILKFKTANNEELIVVPKTFREKICQVYHDSLTSGHLGFEKTFKSIAARFYWPGMKTQIFDYCNSCDTCQKYKSKNLTTQWPLISIKPEKPWSLVGIDVAGPLKLTKNENRYST